MYFFLYYAQRNCKWFRLCRGMGENRSFVKVIIEQLYIGLLQGYPSAILIKATKPTRVLGVLLISQLIDNGRSLQ